MPAHSLSFTKRIERVLVGIAEDKNATVQERLDATRQLVGIKRVKPKPRRVAPKLSGTVEAALGTR